MFRVSGRGFRVLGSGVLGLRFRKVRVQGLGFSVEFLRPRVWDFGFSVLGLVLGVQR